MILKSGNYYRAKGKADIICVVEWFNPNYVFVTFVEGPPYKIEEEVKYHVADFRAMFDHCPGYMATKQFDKELEELLNE